MSVSVEQLNKIIDKSKDKNDGVYSMNGYIYRVVKNNVTHVADYSTCYHVMGRFLVGAFEFRFASECRKKLKEIK